MSSFLAFLPPQHSTLSSYDPTKYHNDQDPTIPETFLDAMSVREQVYVNEQTIPLENEFDADDSRSSHWVAYASVPSSSHSAIQSLPKASKPYPEATEPGAARVRKGSTSTRMPVGTIRCTPPPHEHDEHESHNESPDMMTAQALDEAQRVQKGCLRRGREPYVKLGRLAVLPPFRKLGISTLLLNEALRYAAQHTGEMLPPISPTVVEHRRLEGDEGDDDIWDGLVLVHAQAGIEKLWASWGFVRDVTMGEWSEEGIKHVGMWRRIGIAKRRASLLDTIAL